ncbi:hypothetical protein BDY19DRAFT_912396 [Irpex rosettiformis]|uniref:Uncharacterized protein n=1 Tax=Irpex rosettiformis TaxID=378272 RepID=A0ACB8UJ03_9APHY|nr:hypothetical protein BDY19DRAFT_912396 [Irpex rosettiformis]
MFSLSCQNSSLTLHNFDNRCDWTSKLQALASELVLIPRWINYYVPILCSCFLSLLRQV